MSRVVYSVMFAVVALSILLAVHFYMYWRLVSGAGLSSPWRQAVLGVLVAGLVLMPAAMLLSRVMSSGVGRWVTLVPYVWMALFFLVFTFLVAGEFVRLGWWLGSRFSLWPEAWMGVDGRLRLGRAIAIAAPVLALVLTVFGVVVQAGAPRLVTQRWEFTGGGTGGVVRVVQLSDLHIGPTLGREWLSGVVERVLEERPDVVVITGDLIDGVPELVAGELEPLRGLAERVPVYVVTGNHEYYSGVKPWVEQLGKLGMRVLENEGVEVGGRLCIAGVNDYSGVRVEPGERSDAAAAVAGCGKGRVTLLLAHDPRSVEEASKLGVHLVLSGHTHGGQFWPWTWMVRLQQSHREGRYEVGGTHLYVSPGTGYWGPPVRVGTHSEITVHELEL